MTVPAEGGAGRRHPGWGLVAQVTAVLGSVILVLLIVLTWVVYASTSGAVSGMLADLDAVTAEAQGKYDAAAEALDEQAGRAPNPDGQALLEDGAELVRDVGTQVTSIADRIGDLVDSLLAVLLAVVGMLTLLLAYLIVVHGGIWTLGRHWRRD